MDGTKNMPKLVVYNAVSLDGYFTDTKGDMGWAHKNDPEWQAFVSENASGGGPLFFGTGTHDLMGRFWPTPRSGPNNSICVAARKRLPEVRVFPTLEKEFSDNTTPVKA